MRLRIPNWKRFSLRSLFVLMTLCCLVFGAWGVYVNPYRLQMQALATVDRLDGISSVSPDEGPRWQRWLVTKLLGEEAFVRIDGVKLSNRNVSDKDLRSLAGLCFLEHLLLDYTQISDDGLSALRTMPSLTHISLKYTNVSDRGAAYLSELPNLQQMVLTGTKVSDSAVDDLAKLKQMKWMYIRWTRISNAGADRLRKALPNCEIFHHSLVDKVATSPTH